MNFIKKGKSRKGFTLIELLVVVLILATLMAVALPLYLSSVKDSGKKTCRSNMQSIANAAQAWKVKGRKTDFTGLTLTDLNADLGAEPKCPDGGAYTIASTGTVKGEDGTTDATIPSGSVGISCNHGTGADAHAGFIPGVMSK